MTNPHAVIILASGLSQRLGRSKQLLSKDNQPLIRYMLKLALATEPQAVIIVIPQDNQAIAKAINELATKNSTVNIVMNPIPETGMAHSLYLAIEYLNNMDIDSFADRVLIIGVDQVLLDSDHLNRLLAGEHKVVASSYPHLNKEHITDSAKPNIVGLPITIDCELLKQWQSALTGDKGLRYLIRGLAAEQISTVINNKLSYDIDTPEQLAYAEKQR
ncbi:MAG: nucleotidyltransferase family protein, partial [Psychrobacter sp.]|nr:nucleotidyltransferase family protein [Psychrobacter sp.]